MIARIELPDNFIPSWAGGFSDGYYYGSEDGRLFFNGKVSESLSEESINSITVFSEGVVASTRSEIIFPNKKFPFGSHGVITGTQGTLFASLGISGILSYRPSWEEPVKKKEDIYCYNIANLNSHDETEIIACAARKNGVRTVFKKSR